MSIRVMTAVWDIDLPDSEKIVLLALADCANDEGWCWPSMATMARKCSKSDRTVQASIKALVEAGHLTRIETPGKGCQYCVHPRSHCTPEAVSPPKPLRQPPKRFRGTPEAASDKPSKNLQEPSEGGARARPAPAPGLNDDREKGGGKRHTSGTRLPDDWAPPLFGDLPSPALRLVQQWPVGAYQAVCETFRCHFASVDGPAGSKRDWLAALAKWLIADHPKIMRDAKAGVSFAALVPAGGASAGGAAGAGAEIAAPVPVRAKFWEDAQSAAIHRQLRADLGGQVCDRWLAGAAILPSEDGVTVIVASAFACSWIEDRFSAEILAAARGVCGAAVKWAKFRTEDQG